jgi:hypothetical protein
VLVAKFEKVWTKGGLFSKDSSSLQWQIVPNRNFLPRHIVDYRYRLLIRPRVQMHNAQDISINVNNLREEGRFQGSPTPQSFQLSQFEQGSEG